MKDNKNDLFFSELAKAYAANEGAALINELAEIETTNMLPHTLSLGKKIKSKKFVLKFKNYSLRALPLVACLIIAVMFFRSSGTSPQSPVAEDYPPAYMANAPADYTPTFIEPSAETMNNLLHSIELVSASLPSNYTVTGVDYDNAAAVMEITNEKSNRIVLVTEAYHEFDTNGFNLIVVNGSPAYGLVKKDYCVLKYAKYDMLYTLSGLYDYGDLIEVIENI